VNDVGEEWWYQLSSSDIEEDTPAALERQLAAAVKRDT
jgi:hypothetical protein